MPTDQQALIPGYASSIYPGESVGWLVGLSHFQISTGVSGPLQSVQTHGMSDIFGKLPAVSKRSYHENSMGGSVLPLTMFIACQSSQEDGKG